MGQSGIQNMARHLYAGIVRSGLFQRIFMSHFDRAHDAVDDEVRISIGCRTPILKIPFLVMCRGIERDADRCASVRCAKAELIDRGRFMRSS